MTELSPEAWNIISSSTRRFIHKAKSVGGKRPPCEAYVKLANGETRTKQRRLYRAMRNGTDPRICCKPSMWKIRGRHFCQSHAGQEAIDILVTISNEGSI